MEKEEFSLIVKALKSVYTFENFIPDKYAFEMWYASLGDLSYKECHNAVLAYIQTEEKIPTPAAIRKQITKRIESMGGEEAWAIVYKAIQRGNYHAEADFEKMPIEIQRAIGSPSNIRQMAMDEKFNAGVEKSHFIRIYNNELERKKEQFLLAPNVRAVLEANDER